MLGLLFPFFVVILAPTAISSSDVMLSTDVVSSFPSIERVSRSAISSLPSSTPFMNIVIVSPSKVADRNVHFSGIILVDSIVVHLIPSNTENFAIC